MGEAGESLSTVTSASAVLAAAVTGMKDVLNA